MTTDNTLQSPNDSATTTTTPQRRRHLVWCLAMGVVLVFVAGFLTAPSIPASAVAKPSVSRISGAERTASAIAVSKVAYPNGAPVVYVGSASRFAGNFIAGPVAAAANGPLLLSTQSSISTPTVTEIRRLKPQRIVVVGPTSDISDVVLNAIRSNVVPDTTRRGTGEQYAAARDIIASSFTTSKTAVMVSGKSWTGVLAAMGAAGALRSPLVPVDGSKASIDQATKDQLTTLGVTRVVIAGGASAISAGIEAQLRQFVPTVDRADGADHYAVSISLAKLIQPTAAKGYLVSGQNYSEALGIASLAARQPGAVFMSQATCVPDTVKAEIVRRTELTSAVLVGSSQSLGNGVAALTPCSSASAQTKAASEKALLNKLNAALPGLPGGHNITVFETGGMKRNVDVRGSNTAEPASSIKLFAAYAALKRIDQGRLYYSTKLKSGYTLAQCMRAMIHISDNYCHSDIISLIGANNMNAIFASEGYSATHYAGMWKGKYYSYKTSTTNDMSTLLWRLNAGTLLSSAGNAFLLKLMKEQFWTSRIGSAIPAGVKIATKPGELWVSSGMTQIDAGLVYSPAGTYSVVIMGYRGATKASVARLARIVYEHFNGTIAKVATCPVQQLKTTRATVLRASAGGKAVTTIGAGVNVEALDSVRLWYRVIANGRTGYVSSLDLANRYGF